MAYTKRQVVTTLSILYLIVLTAVAGYALHSIRSFSLPIPTILGALGVGLPAIAGLSIESVTEFRRRRDNVLFTQSKSTTPQGKQNYVTIVVSVLLVLETVIATLSGTYLIPQSGLTCSLSEQWMRLFQAKNENRIKRIQDSFNCCGLRSPADMAWPFPTKDTPSNTCSKRFERSNSCLESWRAEEQKVAGLILLVTVLVFLWKMLIVCDPLERPTFVHRILRIPVEEEDSERRDSAQRRLGYRDTPEQYTDDAQEEAEDIARPVLNVGSSGDRD